MSDQIILFLSGLSGVQFGAIGIMLVSFALLIAALFTAEDEPDGDLLKAEAQKQIQLLQEREKNLNSSLKKESDRVKRDRTKQVARSISDNQKTDENSKSFESKLTKSGLKLTKKQLIYAGVAIGSLVFLIVYYFMGSIPGAVLMSLPFGYFSPRMIVASATRKRQAAFIRQFPEALDAIARGVVAGMPIKECISLVAEESAEPVAGEFKQIIARLSLGVPLKDAIRIIADRIPIPETNFFAIAIAIQQQTGGSISETIRNLSKLLRDRKALRDKVAAATMEAKVSAVIIGSLPIAVATFINFSNPGYMAPLFNTTMGNVIIIGAAVWMLIGIALMAVLINFKI